MRRSYLVLLLLFILSFPLLYLSGCSKAPDFWAEAKPGQKKILVSFPPLYCITYAVAGEDAYVLCLLTTDGPHDYDGAPTDALKVSDADLVVSNGLGLDDSFVDKMLRAARKLPLTLNVGEMMEEDRLHKDKGHVHADGKRHVHGTHDPHIWLGPKQGIAMTRIIADKLGKIDPAHQAGYTERAAKFIAELEKLEAYGKNAFKDKKHKNIVTMHESFGYFVEPFGLMVVQPIQIKPGTDPDSASLAKLVELCREKNVQVIAVEPQYSKAQAQTLQNTLRQRGLAVTLVELDPLETAPKASRFNPDPGYYLTRMRENIDTLARALP